MSAARTVTRFFGQGGFFTADRKGRFVPVVSKGETRTSPEFPFVLNTGRIRDHWHTMTRTGKSPRLSQHLAEPFAEIHPGDAEANGIREADIVRAENRSGAVLVRALLTGRQARGSIFVPMHWNGQFAAQARVDMLVPALTDPHSGQPASKHSAARIVRFDAKAHGFAVLRDKPALLDAPYWALAKCSGGWRLELAVSNVPSDWALFARALFGRSDEVDIAAYHDANGQRHRFASFEKDRLVGALFIAAEPVAVSREWVVEQLGAIFVDQRARHAVIAGRPSDGAIDRGAIVCSCFGVGINQIVNVVDQGRVTVETVGEALQAGTGCGSCLSEIKRIIDVHRRRAAE